MAYLKDDFEKWISSLQRKNGESYSKETINNYIGVIKNFCNKLNNLNIPSLDLFNIDSSDEFELIFETIKNHPEYEQINKSYHRSFSSGLLMYQRFLSEQAFTASNEKKFINWLKKYTEHTYRESTITRYVAALKKAEERLEIELEIPVLCIKDSKGFEKAFLIIHESPKYEFVNKKYGNGDLSAALSAYRKFIEAEYNISDNWWPSLEEYTPGFTKEQWLEILNNPEIIGPVWGGVLAMLHTEPDGATCKMLAEKFNDSPQSISGKCSQLADKIHSETRCPLFVDERGKFSYWSILFQGREVKGDESGSWVWRLRKELYDALTEFGIEKYLPNVSKFGKFDSWEIIDENTAIKTCDKSFFEHKGSGVPKNICWFFDAEDISSGESNKVELLFDGSTYIGKVRNDTTDRRRIQIFWNTDLANCLEKHRTPNATATFKKIDKNTYKISMSKEGEKMTTKEKVVAIKNYIASKGFNYEGNLIENFYLSLKSKPFVILAGTSGTGKTRLVKLFAEAIDAKMLLVPVRPDWSDSSDLFGHVDLSGKFNPGAILEFIKEAQDNTDKPYFLCLDEMNLARVEYYFSDFLSIIETRENVEGKIVSDPLVDEKYYKKDTAAAEKYGKIIIPENIYIIGTVNMDETTFPFSKKVLDRANTIEFSFVDLMAKPSVNSEALPKALNEENSFLKTEYLYFNDVEYNKDVENLCSELADLNDILLGANLHVGYRVRDEITFYMINNKNAAELIPNDAAFDNQIMQKILPRIQGSSTSIRKVLINLFKKCGYFDGLDDTNSSYDELDKCIESKDCKYPNSAKKIAFMVRRFDEDGFTSYWL